MSSEAQPRREWLLQPQTHRDSVPCPTHCSPRAPEAAHSEAGGHEGDPPLRACQLRALPQHKVLPCSLRPPRPSPRGSRRCPLWPEIWACTDCSCHPFTILPAPSRGRPAGRTVPSASAGAHTRPGPMASRMAASGGPASDTLAQHNVSTHSSHPPCLGTCPGEHSPHLGLERAGAGHTPSRGPGGRALAGAQVPGRGESRSCAGSSGGRSSGSVCRSSGTSRKPGTEWQQQEFKPGFQVCVQPGVCGSQHGGPGGTQVPCTDRRTDIDGCTRPQHRAEARHSRLHLHW